ncbi:hypothetical protein ACIBCT_25585 [Streptosporangium sp. NPDC050855]|uniref:hypothetical protein n=1 Tax=Streptosporangium sp. NPDC050855 TaxID=3366194 RepID=UPI0037BC8EED
MKINRSAGAALGIAAVLATSLATVTPAEAAACEVQIGRTSKSGSQIVGYGSLSGCPSSSTAQLFIQRQTAPGFWSRVSAIATARQGYDVYVRYNCSGTGTQSYRTQINGTTIGGTAKIKNSNTIRVSC